MMILLCMKVSDVEIDVMGKILGFVFVQCFYVLNLCFEGNCEWNWLLCGMIDCQLFVVVEYGKCVELFDCMVNIVDCMKVEYDFMLCYLLLYCMIVECYVQLMGFDVEWVYGLICQELCFIISVCLLVGVGGLMQLMLVMVQMVVKKFGMGMILWVQMYDIDINIQFGIWYLVDIYNNFDSLLVFVIVGYNVGLGWLCQWCQVLMQLVEGVIFVEMILFNEMCDYVKNVLLNIVYYVVFFEGKLQLLKKCLGMILF